MSKKRKNSYAGNAISPTHRYPERVFRRPVTKRVPRSRDTFLSNRTEIDRGYDSFDLAQEDAREFYPSPAFPNRVLGTLRSPNVVVHEVRHPKNVNLGRPRAPAAGRSLYSAPVTRISEAVPKHVAFDVPRELAVCIRRKTRKQVLIAKGGRGSRRPKRRNLNSSVVC